MTWTKGDASVRANACVSSPPASRRWRMKVEVRLFALLERYLPAGARGDAIILDLPAGTTVGHVVASLKIPTELLCVTVVHGHAVPPEHILVAGDVLAMFPPLAGGA